MLAGSLDGGNAAPGAFQISGADKMQANPQEGSGPSQQQEDKMEDASNDSPDDDMSDGGGDPQQRALAMAGQPQMLTDMPLAQDAPDLS